MIRPIPLLTVEETADFLLTFQRPCVVMHRRPDGDTVGSTAALLRMLLAMGKPAYAVCQDKVPERLAFLTAGLNVLTELPEEKADVLTVDVASVPQMGTLADRLTGDRAPLLMIDHHETGERFAPCLLNPRAAAAGEIVFAIGQHWVKQGILPRLSTSVRSALYAALSSDTGCFRYSNTTPDTLRAAALLLEDPAVNAAEVNRLLFETKSEKQLLAEAFAIEHTRTALDGKIAYTSISLAERKSLGVEEEHLETMIDMARSREGAEVAFAVRENDDGTFKASLRSSGRAVSDVAASFGGGGHLRAAGCSIPASSTEEAVALLLQAVKKLFN